MSCEVLQADHLESFRRRYYDRNRPVVIRGLADTGRFEIFDWSVAYFKKLLGDLPVPIIESDSGFLSYERDVEPIPFRDFAERSFGLQRSADRFYYFKNPTKILPPNHDDSDRIPVLGEYIKKAVLRNLWISRGGITVGLHFDPAENFNFSLQGEKTFDLYPPGVRDYYPMPIFSRAPHISRVFRNGPSPNLGQFPRFDPSRVTRVHLRQGDVLYLPAYWWHQVQSLGDENVNLNFWLWPPVWKRLRHWNQALRGYSLLAGRLMKFGNIEQAPPVKERQS